jgi:hypothetical protein
VAFNLIVANSQVLKVRLHCHYIATSQPASFFSPFLVMVKITVNQIIPAAKAAIDAYAEKARDNSPELRHNLEQAHRLVATLHQRHDDFHRKIERFGPEKPNKFAGGHEWNIRQRCFGDGLDPHNCGRWFVKVSASHNIALAAEIDLE